MQGEAGSECLHRSSTLNREHPFLALFFSENWVHTCTYVHNCKVLPGSPHINPIKMPENMPQPLLPWIYWTFFDAFLVWVEVGRSIVTAPSYLVPDVTVWMTLFSALG